MPKAPKSKTGDPPISNISDDSGDPRSAASVSIVLEDGRAHVASASPSLPPSERTKGPEMPSHRFKEGDVVDAVEGKVGMLPPGRYKIVRLMPPTVAGGNQY